MNTKTESGLLMQWQQTLKEGPGCNQLLLPALGHRPENIEECHCITQLRIQMKSSAVLVYKFYKCFLNHRNTDGVQSQPLFMSLWNPWKEKCLLVLLLFIFLFVFQYGVGNFDKLEFLPTSLLFFMKECVWGKRFLLGYGQEESGVRIYNRELVSHSVSLYFLCY